MANILVVDDDPAILDYLGSLLERSGHSVRFASDGSQVAACLEDGVPDLLITDIVMPGKEGLELILEMKAANPSLRILAISGGARLPERQPPLHIDPAYYLDLATDMGAEATLAKPFHPIELLHLIEKILKNEPLIT